MDQIRSHRLFGIALFDLISSFVGAWLIDHFLLKLSDKAKPVYYLSVIPLGILVHILFNQKTFLNSKVFSKELNMYNGFFILNVFLIFFFLYKQ